MSSSITEQAMLIMDRHADALADDAARVKFWRGRYDFFDALKERFIVERGNFVPSVPKGCAPAVVGDFFATLNAINARLRRIEQREVEHV